MKRTILSFLLLALFTEAQAADSPYLAALKVTHDHFNVLEMERSDYRKPKPGLPAAKEEEYFRLLGKLLTDDPVWALARQIQADIDVLSALPARTPADGAIVDSLKDLLAYVSGFLKCATTRAQAEQFATALRQFVVRRDVAGASTWAKSQ